MKHLLILIFGIFIAQTAYADCSRNRLSIFPNGPTINQNPIFIIDGYANSQNIILGLNIKYNVYLKSGKKKVRLLVSEVCKGQFLLTQAILKPETELEVGVEYTMFIDSLPESENLNKYNETTSKYEPFIYKVITGKDTICPQLLSRPKEINNELVYYGCGPSIHVIFNNPTKDASALIVKTTVKSMMSGIETTYYIIPDDDRIYIGHGMCSGAFVFDNCNDYEVEFSFMDASGNVTPWIGDRIRFSPPKEEIK